MKHGNLFVWVQHGHKRDATKTFESLKASDIGERFTVVTDPNDWDFPLDFPKLQLWWEDHMLRTAEQALALGCEFVLRLEDDIKVNEHILHNVSTWSALSDPTFGIGTLFQPNSWRATPWCLQPSEHSSSTYYDSPDVEGAQGQVYRAAEMARIIPATRKARGSVELSFDWALTRAFAHNPVHNGFPLRTFVHLPALVDIHRESCNSLLSGTQDPEFHYWGYTAFSQHWRRMLVSRDAL